MKLIYCLFFISISLNQIWSQTLFGVVKDAADNSPVAFATAALLRPDSSVITGVMAIDNGTFVIDKVAEGDYIVQVSFLGYEKKNLKVNVPTQSDLGDILLNENATMLEEVVVTSTRPLVVQRLDRIVVNVAGNIITSGLNVQDLLKQLPGLVVDQYGSVKLNGKTATVYIDGRPTRLPAEQIVQMLNGMMGDVVDRVELIDNPSSRYEADLSAAIVNIRLKRDASLGINGTAQMGVGFTEHNFASQGGLNLNYRSKKINLYGNYGYSNISRNSDIYQTCSYGGTVPKTYDQHTLLKNWGPSNTLRAGIDWFITPKQTIGFLFNGTHINRDGDMAAKANIMRTGTSKVDSIELSDSRTINKSRMQMYNLNYRLAIKEGEEITMDVDYGNVYAHSWQNMQRHYLETDGNEKRPSSEFQNKGPRNIDILSLKIDYVKPFWEKSRLEAGLKTGQTITDNEFLWENLINGSWEADLNESNRFRYIEKVSAAYATFSHQFGKFSAMAGLRAEYTSFKGESATIDTSFTHSYFDWFPSAYLQYQINSTQVLNISYSRKIGRPSFSSLNPFRTYIDPFTFQSGNPDLKPCYLSSIALRYKIKSYSVNLSYNTINDMFFQDYIQDDATHTTGLIQKNIGKSQFLSLGVYAPIKFTAWYTLNINTQIAYNKDDTYHNGERFLHDFINANASLQHILTIMPTMRAYIQMLWSKPSWQGINYFKDVYYMSAQIEKSFWDHRLSLTLSCNDLFSSMVYRSKINFGNINQTAKEDQHQRRILLTARYNFGSQQIRGARNRSVGIDEEMGRAR